MSKEAWGAITAIGVALITAIVTLTTHFYSRVDKPEVASPAAVVTTPVTASADAIAGHWRGNATDANGGSFTIDVSIAQGCTVNARCGTISVSHVPCKGAIFLAAVQQGDHEFRVDNFEPPSAPACTAGAGEHFQLAADGSLLYTTTYDPKAHATLTRQN